MPSDQVQDRVEFSVETVRVDVDCGDPRFDEAVQLAELGDVAAHVYLTGEYPA